MPKRPLRPCSHPGCPNLCEGQFCEQHRVEERRKYDKYERSSDVNRKYGRAWKRIRDRYAAEHPLYEMCLMEGRLRYRKFTTFCPFPKAALTQGTTS